MSGRDAFGQVLAALHRAALHPENWPAASGLIERASGAKGSALMVCSEPSIRPESVCYWRVCFAGRRYADLERAFVTDYWRHDQRIPRVRRLEDGRLVPTSDLYTPEERKSSPTYAELMARTDMQQGLHVRLDVPDGLQIVWALGDSTDTKGWSSVQIATIERLLPHLRHFASMRQALADARALGNSLTELLDNTSAGVIQLDREGRIVEASVHAARLLRGGGGLSDAGGVLRAEMPRDDARLQRVLAEALPPLGMQGSAGSTTVGRTQSRSRLLVCVTPVPGRESDFPPMRRVAALVLIIDPERRPAIDPGLVATALDLTPSESRLAVMLATGHSVRDIAERTNRSENTVRWHLKRIFRKQGFSSQADLVNRVLYLGGFLKPPE